MALAEGKVSILRQNELAAVDSLTALTADGIAIPFNVAEDAKMLLAVQNSGGSAGSITVKQGNGLQGVRDYTVAIPAGETWYGVFESGAFVNVGGSNAGKLVLTGPTTMKAGAIALPF